MIHHISSRHLNQLVPKEIPEIPRCYEVAVNQLLNDGTKGSTPLWMYYAPWQRLPRKEPQMF